MCLVEMENSAKPIASCAMPVAEGMNSSLILKWFKRQDFFLYGVFTNKSSIRLSYM